MTFLPVFRSGLRSGLRLAIHRPAFAWTCIGILALGLGLAASLSGAVYSLILRPLPFDGAERFVAVRAGTGEASVDPRDFLDWRQRSNQEAARFDTLAAYSMYMGLVTALDPKRAPKPSPAARRTWRPRPRRSSSRSPAFARSPGDSSSRPTSRRARRGWR